MVLVSLESSGLIFVLLVFSTFLRTVRIPVIVLMLSVVMVAAAAAAAAVVVGKLAGWSVDQLHRYHCMSIRQ